MGTNICLKKRILMWSGEKRRFVYRRKEMYDIAEKKSFEYVAKTEAVGDHETRLQQASNRTSMKGKPIFRARWSSVSSVLRMPSSVQRIGCG